MKKKKVTLSIDSKTYSDFQKYCNENAIVLSKRVEIFIDNFMKHTKDKKVMSVLFGLLMIIALLEIISAATFSDTSQANFNQGTYANTTHNGSAVVLVGTNLTGTYTSQIFNAGGLAIWNNVSWIQGAPYQQELPNNQAVESILGGANMSKNVLLLHMNEASGTIVDYSGYGNNGTTYGGITYGAIGKLNSALRFDGINDGIVINASSSLDIGTAVSIGLWFYANNCPTQASPENYDAFVMMQTNSGGYHRGIWGNGSCQIYLQPGTVGTEAYQTDVQYPLNQWTYMTINFYQNGSNVVHEIYINGILKNSYSYSSATMWSDAGDYKIGVDQIGRYFNGTIDEIAIWNRSLSASEISSIYKRGALRLNLTVRSCDDSACSGESWIDVNDSSPQTLSVTNNSYFQYKFDFSTDNVSNSPGLYNVTIDYTPADTTPPSIAWSSSTPNNGSSQSASSVYVNVSSSDASTHYTLLDWNNSLVGWWRLESGNGTFFADDSGRGNNGTCSNGNCPLFDSSGIFGGSHIFNSSSSSYIQVAYNGDLNFSKSDKMSISLWFNYRNSQSAGLVSNRAGSSSSYNLYLSTTNLILDIANQTTHQTTSTYPVSLNTWYHVVATYNGSVMNLYVNGTLVRMQNQTGNIQSQTTNLFIGRYQSSYLNGSLDDVLIFNRALSSSEVLALYNATANQYYNNFTGLTDGNYSFKAYAVDVAGNKNNTETMTVTLISCTANMTNTTWSAWSNLSCSGSQMNQSRFKTEYDSNACGFVNVTYYEYQLVGPTYANTSWSGWTNISCLSNDKMNQSKNLTQYDIYGCATNSTITEYRTTETCDYCTPSLVNTSWSSWYNITACLPGDYYTQERNATQYDSNNCGEILNSTVSERQNLSCTYNKIPVVTIPSITPATAYTNNDLNCSFTVTDEDAGDSLIVNYTWYNGSNAVISGSISVSNGTEASITLNAGNTTKGETWNCSIKPYDGYDYGSEKSAVRTVSNSLPTAPVVDVIPDSPSDNEDLVATIVTASVDADNDSITYSRQWYKNDVLQVGETASTLSNLLTSIGDNWKCIVTPNDGTANGATGQDNVTIVSSDTTAPSITIVNPTNGSALSSGTTETYVNITTNENATCKYSVTSSTFSFGEGTNFTTTGNLLHSFLFSGMSDGQSYTLYYKCNDTSGNVNSASTAHSFSVSAAPYCGDGSCNNGETCSSCSADCGSCGGGSHGGGGGGSSTIIIQNKTNISQPVSPSQQLLGCTEDWKCGEWTECTVEGIQVRACSDDSNCGTTISKPSEIQSCAKPTCSDGIQNQEELGIDCGGSCAKRCGIGELSGKIVQVPSPENSAKSKYGILLIGLLFVLVGMLTMITRMEQRVKMHIHKSHILTHIHEHHYGTPVNPEANHRKDIGRSKLKLLLMNIAHIIVIIVIIVVIYYFIK
jgi:hypothetical protein